MDYGRVYVSLFLPCCQSILWSRRGNTNQIRACSKHRIIWMHNTVVLLKILPNPFSNAGIFMAPSTNERETKAINARLSKSLGGGGVSLIFREMKLALVLEWGISWLKPFPGHTVLQFKHCFVYFRPDSRLFILQAVL